MQSIVDNKRHREYERAFLSTLAETLRIVLARDSNLPKKDQSELLSNLTFAVAAHLAGSSFGGMVNNEEIYPKLGFCVGEDKSSLCLGDGSTMIDQVSEVLASIESS